MTRRSLVLRTLLVETLVALAIFGGGGFLCAMYVNGNIAGDAFAKAIIRLAQSYSLRSGITSSPTIMETTNNYTYFTQVLDSLNITTVYELIAPQSNVPTGAFLGVANTTYGILYTPSYEGVDFWWWKI